MKQYILKIVVITLVLLFHGSAQINLSNLSLQTNSTIKEPVTATLTRQYSSDSSNITLTLQLVMDENIHIYSVDSLFFKLLLSDTTGVSNILVQHPESKKFINFDGSTVGVYVGGQHFIIKATINSISWKIAGSLEFQACDSAMCFTPRSIRFTSTSEGMVSTSAPLPIGNSGETDTRSGIVAETDSIIEQLNSFTITGVKGGFLPVREFNTFLSDPSGDMPTATTMFDNHGLIAIIVLILLGGIALNFTPCVLPMIPITIAVIGAGAQAKSRWRGTISGAVYGCAMALTYGILGLTVVVSGTRFGVINASPLFNIVIAVIFVVLALAMFDVIQIDFTRFRKSGGTSTGRGKLITVFVMGVVTSLLAGACVAPVVIAVVVYSGTLYAEGNTIGLALPFLLGVGMAFPWPFAGAGLSLLPKPGKWMVWVKYIFGIFILGMALYYGVTGASLFKKHIPESTRKELTDKKDLSTSIPWQYDLRTALQQSLVEKKPIFIDFWATWCKNCKAMDATTFMDPSVVKQMKQFIPVKYQAERPKEQSTKEMLDHFGIVGLPSYIIMKPKSED